MEHELIEIIDDIRSITLEEDLKRIESTLLKNPSYKKLFDMLGAEGKKFILEMVLNSITNVREEIIITLVKKLMDGRIN